MIQMAHLSELPDSNFPDNRITHFAPTSISFLVTWMSFQVTNAVSMIPLPLIWETQKHRTSMGSDEYSPDRILRVIFL